MDCIEIYTLWTNYKTKKRIITEKKIKGRCELRARHWKLLERHWYVQFARDNPTAKTKQFYIFTKYHPDVKDRSLIYTMKSVSLLLKV